MRFFTVVLWCVWVWSTLDGYVISRDKREVLIQPIDSGESDLLSTFYEVTHGESDEERSLLSRKREERKVLLELYYLGKVLRAYRRPGAYGSPIFRSALERMTNKDLLDQLERKLRKENGFEVIARIGSDGTVPDRMQVQLANDYRLLAPIVVRTLRKVLSLKHGAGGLDLNDKEDAIGGLLRDEQREWESLQWAMKQLKGDGVAVVFLPEEEANSVHGEHVTNHKDPVYYESSEPDVVHPAPDVPDGLEEVAVETDSNDLHQGYQWADVKEPVSVPETTAANHWGSRPQAFDSETYHNLFPGYKPSSMLWAGANSQTEEGVEDNPLEASYDDTESSVQVLDGDEPINLIDDQDDQDLVDEGLSEKLEEVLNQIPEDMVFESLQVDPVEGGAVEEVDVHPAGEVTLSPLVDFQLPDEPKSESPDDIPEDMVIGQFVDDNEESAITEQSTGVSPDEAPVDIPQDMVFEALTDNNEDGSSTVTETPWAEVDEAVASSVPEDIPEDMVLAALVDTTEPPPYVFSDDLYAQSPSDELEDEGRKNSNRRRQQLLQQQQHHQQQQPAPVVIIQQTTTTENKVSPSAALLNEQVERAARELIAIELDKFLLLVEDISGLDGVSDEFDRADRTRMIGWVNEGFSPTVGLDQRDLIKAMFKLLNTKELSRGRLDVLGALEFLQAQLETQARGEKDTPIEQDVERSKEDDYFARLYGAEAERDATRDLQDATPEVELDSKIDSKADS